MAAAFAVRERERKKYEKPEQIRGFVVWLSRAVAHDWAGGASKGAWGYINY